MEEGGKGGPGDPPTVGHILVQQPRGADEKRARCWDDHRLEVRGNDVEVQGRPAGNILVLSREARTRREPELGPLLGHPRQTMARSLWICPRRAGPAAEERQRMGEAGTRGRGRPQQAH